MEKIVSAFEARRQFGSLLNGVDARGDRIIVTRHGEPVAAVVPMAVYEQWCRQRDEFNAMWDELASRVDPNLVPEEIDALIEEAVQAVRAERRALA